VDLSEEPRSPKTMIEIAEPCTDGLTLIGWSVGDHVMDPDFEKELATLINGCGVDAYCDVSDFGLAAYLVSVVEALKRLPSARLDT
jgi:hypothetical protein